MRNRSWARSSSTRSENPSARSTSSRASTSMSRTASSSSSSGRPAAGSRRCCASSRASRSRPRAMSASTSASSTSTPPAKRGIAMVFQTYALYPHLDVKRNMSLALQQEGAPKAEIEARVAKAAGHAAARGAPCPPAGRALGRAAPARRHRARHRARAEPVPVRRAAVQPRRGVCASAPASRSPSSTASSAPPWSTSPTTRSRR